MSLATAKPDYVRPIRSVPAFTVQSLQAYTVTESAPLENVRQSRPAPVTWLRILYESRRIPVKLAHANRFAIVWQVATQDLDVERLLPIFFDGLTETTHPYNLLARQGITSLLDIGKQRVPCLIDTLIPSISKALNTRIPDVIGATLIALKQLACSDPRAGPLLVPYFPKILPMLRMFYYWQIEVETQVNVAPVQRRRLDDMISDTLHTLESRGGPSAFPYIKHSIPNYSSWLCS